MMTATNTDNLRSTLKTLEEMEEALTAMVEAGAIPESVLRTAEEEER